MRKSTPIDVWLLQAAQLWNNLASEPHPLAGRRLDAVQNPLVAGRSSVLLSINECLDKVYAQQLAHLTMVRHLISPIWVEEL